MSINSSYRTIITNNIEGVVAPKNYINNGFEVNSTDPTVAGWHKFNATLTSGLPTGTPTLDTAASISTFSITSDGNAINLYNKTLQVVASSGWLAGQGIITDVFTVDRADLAKVLTIKFSYECTSGTVNWSGILGSQSFAIYVYDVTTPGWVQPAGFLGMNQGTGAGFVSATFQTSNISGQQYRLAIVALQSTTGSTAVNFDNFTVSTQISPIGGVVTDWVSYTPTFTGFGTAANVNFKSRRVGDSLQVLGYFQAGTVTATLGLVTLGYAGVNGNVVIDTNKAPSLGVLGSGATNSTPTTTYFGNITVLANGATNYVTFGAQSSTTNALSPANANTLIGNNSYVSFYCEVPIVGWSSNVQMSSDSYQGVNILNASTVPATVPVGIVNFSGSSFQGPGSYSSGLFTVAQSGWYILSGKGLKSTGVSSDLYVQKNGTNIDYFSTVSTNGSSASYPLQLNAGDTIGLYNNTASWSPAVAGWVSMALQRVSGPAVLAATETVAALYQNSSGQSIPAGVSTTITNWTKVFDTNSFLNATTGEATIPVSGKYFVSAGILYSTNTAAVNAQYSIQLQKNGTDFEVLGAKYTETTQSVGVSITGGSLIPLNAGDVIRLQTYQGSAGARVLINQAVWNYFSIVRVGN